MRLDQPFSRVADALLDKQYWAPDDPQKHPYDDTGWSFSQLFNVKAVRLTDTAILKAQMTPVTDFDQHAGKLRVAVRSTRSPILAKPRFSPALSA